MPIRCCATLLAVDPHVTLAGFGAWLRGLPPRTVAGLRQALQGPDRLSGDDRAWLGATAPWPACAAGRTMVRGAGRLLRAFAGRLPGFVGSGFAHLHANFLSLTASVERSDTQTTVRLGRPPLDLILGLAGLHRRAIEVAWIEPPRMLLYPGE